MKRPKKILIVMPSNASFLSGIMRALNFLEVDTMFFDSRKFSKSEKFINLLNKQKAVALLNNRLVNFAKEAKPDLLLAMKAETISEDSINEIKSEGIKTANWFPDLNYPELSFRLSKAYDHFFHFEPKIIRQLHGKKCLNVHYLPFCADILPLDKAKKSKKIYPVVFIGNHYPIREKYLEKLSDSGLSIWGDARWSNSKLKKNYQGQLPADKIKKTLSQSLLSINIQHENPNDGAVLRVFETLQSGTLLLTERKKAIEKLFKAGEDLDFFDNEADLHKKAIRYLNDEKTRERLAKNGNRKVAKKHTYLNRLDEIFRIMS